MELNGVKSNDHHQHIVLVHGLCHGAWCWYRLVDCLRSSAPDRPITAVDLGGCGADPRGLDEVRSFSDYVRPLMELLESLPQGDRVLLVGHSYGGFPVALAMERFPEKVSAAVFLTALMPSCSSPLGLLIQEYFRRSNEEVFLDCKFNFDNEPRDLPSSVEFGPKFIETNLYSGCPPEDIELGKMSARPSSLYVEELMGCVLTEERYGSVKRVFVVCEEDPTVDVGFQQHMIENSPPEEVRTITGAYHMVMFSRPKDLCLHLDEIAARYR